jgi:hypothetical protein
MVDLIEANEVQQAAETVGKFRAKKCPTRLVS